MPPFTDYGCLELTSAELSWSCLTCSQEDYLTAQQAPSGDRGTNLKQFISHFSKEWDTTSLSSGKSLEYGTRYLKRWPMAHVGLVFTQTCTKGHQPTSSRSRNHRRIKQPLHILLSCALLQGLQMQLKVKTNEGTHFWTLKREQKYRHKEIKEKFKNLYLNLHDRKQF